jgi:hypothetical protein
MASPQRPISPTRFVELTLHYCMDSKTGTPAVWACRHLARANALPENFDLFLDALFRLSRDFPPSLHYVAAFIINHQELCREAHRLKRIEHWVRSSIRANIQNSNDFETAWYLLVCGVMGISMDEVHFNPSTHSPNSVVFAILGLLRERNLLKFSLDKWKWRARFNKNGPLKETWLPHYEAVRRKWTKDPQTISAITNDPLLNDMLQAGVTFLEDKALEASAINLSRRSYRVRPARPKTITPQSETDLAVEDEHEPHVSARDEFY